MEQKKLPIGIQTFREIREDGHYYVDKTGYAVRLVTRGKTYFLSRPRRFGKSLFLDTLAEMFAGNKALFEGLACYDRWDWDTVYPVVRISFAAGVMRDPAQLGERIGEILAENAARLGVEIGAGTTEGRFAALLREAHARFGQRAVVLVDEYDKPILDNLSNLGLARSARDELRNLYSVIKDQDAHVRFVFLTGVSKFAKAGIFSGLNNLTDITLDPAYSAICGYTEADVDEVFGPELEGVDRAAVRSWYNGYNWTGEAVYNPFDALLYFRNRRFGSYWFETGTPTFLIDLLQDRRFFLPDLEAKRSSLDLMSAFDVGEIGTDALLFQTGYLTIAGLEDRLGETVFTLRLPNREVRAALNALLLRRWTGRDDLEREKSALAAALVAADLPGVEAAFRALFAGVPTDWYRHNPIAQYEGYYASVFYAALAGLGLPTSPEHSSNAGRLDLAVPMADQVYLFEFKVLEHGPDDDPLRQIQERGYAAKYRDRGVPIHQVGIRFSEEARNIVTFAADTIPA
jgi:hypothetical protein